MINFLFSLPIILSWPIVVLIIFLCLLYPLLKFLNKLIDKADFFSGGFGSIWLKIGAQNTYGGVYKDFGSFELRTVIEEGNIIKKELIDKKYSEVEAIGMLIYWLAHQTIHARFLIFDRFIEASHISVLEYLNTQNNPIPFEKFENFCDQLESNKEDYIYDSFISWLIENNLIQKHILELQLQYTVRNI